MVPPASARTINSALLSRSARKWSSPLPASQPLGDAFSGTDAGRTLGSLRTSTSGGTAERGEDRGEGGAFVYPRLIATFVRYGCAPPVPARRRGLIAARRRVQGEVRDPADHHLARLI